LTVVLAAFTTSTAVSQTMHRHCTVDISAETL